MGINEIISSFEKEETIKSVFSITKNKYNDLSYKEAIDSSEYSNGINLVVAEIFGLLELYKRQIENYGRDDKRLEEIKQVVGSTRFEAYKGIGDDKDNIYALIYMKILLTIYLSMGYVESDYDFNNDQKPHNESNRFYRGHSNSDYELMPTIYRDLNYNGIIDLKALSNIYKEAGLVDRYRERIDYKCKDIDYSFASYMQHSISYSPLLDFTSDKEIALVFATEPGGKNINSYRKNNACLFEFCPTQLPSLNLKSLEQSVQYYKERLKWDSEIFGKPLFMCSINDFTVDYQYSLDQTNDRMKYQKGLFLYFKKCVIAKGHLFFPFSQGCIKKKIIYSKDNEKKASGKALKPEIYNRIIDKDSSLDVNHLLNPYLFVSEYTENTVPE